MKRWIDYTDRLGSDGCISCDGRWSIKHCIDYAVEFANRQRAVNSSKVRTFTILGGVTLMRARPITPEFTVIPGDTFARVIPGNRCP